MKKINVTKTYLPPIEEYQEYLERIWKSNWITNRGALVSELEAKLSQYLGLEQILFTNNGTNALQIALKALNVSGEVITTPFSYVATTSSLVWQDCKPVFIDIDYRTLCINPNLIERAITKKTTAILATHVYGIPCNTFAIQKIANQYGLKVIYDAAHCFGVKYKNKSILEYGDISALSFHATKLFHTAEGGAIITKDHNLLQKAYYMHNFGHNGFEDFYGLGINGKASELHAAIGLCILPKVAQFIQKRKQLSEYYDCGLEGLNLRKPTIPADTLYNYAYYPIIFSSESVLLEVQKQLNHQNIFPRRYFYPALNTLNYIQKNDCPIAEKIASEVLCLPLYESLELEDIYKIIKTIKSIC